MNKTTNWTAHAFRYQRVDYLAQHLFGFLSILVLVTEMSRSSKIVPAKKIPWCRNPNEREKIKQDKVDYNWISQDIVERALARIVLNEVRIAHRGVSQLLCV